jgi:hypothetical protein
LFVERNIVNWACGVRTLKANANIGNTRDMLSCIVIMDLVIAEDFKDRYDRFDRNPTKRNRTHEILYNDLTSKGTRLMLEDRELYSRVYSFDKYKDCKFEESFDSPIEEVDFSSMVEKDVWAYIFGEYMLGEGLSIELNGFGLIPI